MTAANRITVGNPYYGLAGTAAFSNQALSASGTKVGWVFQAVNANAITKVLFRYGARTGTPPVYKAGLQGVNLSTGAPDGTYLGGGSPASVTFTPPADTTWNGTIRELTLDNAYTPARGDKIALVVEYSSGTVDASNNGSISYQDSANGASNTQQNMPYSLINTGSWSKNTFSPVFAVKTASDVYGWIYSGNYATAASTNGHRSAMKFTIPGGAGTYKVVGFRAAGLISFTTGKAPVFALWDGTTALQSVTWDSDVVGQSAFGWNECFFDESTLSDLNFGSSYRIGYQCNDAAAGNVYLHGFQATSGNLSFPGSTDWILSTWDGATWTDDATVRPRVELYLDDITISAGGSGGGIRLAGHGGLCA